MIKCKICLLAGAVIRDSLTNNMTVFRIFEEIKADSFPLTIPEADFFAYLERDKSDPSELKAVLNISLDKKEIISVPIVIEFLDKLAHRSIVHLAGMPILGPGKLIMKLKRIKGRVLASYELNVVLSGKPPTTSIISAASGAARAKKKTAKKKTAKKKTAKKKTAKKKTAKKKTAKKKTAN